MSQAGIINVAGSGTGVIETITGNDAVAESPIGNNFTFLTAHSTVKFVGSPGTETLDFAVGNLILGGNASPPGSATNNVGLGTGLYNSITTGDSNTFVGNNVSGSPSVTTGSQNCGYGENSLVSLSTGSGNCAFGYESANRITTGNDNIAIGLLAGQNYTSSQSSNIVISNDGVITDSHTIRIGTDGSGSNQQNRAFLAGVQGSTVVGNLVNITSLGQLGAVANGTTGQILQANTSASPSYSTATYPSSTTINQLLYSSADNVVAGLANGTTGQVLTATTGSAPSWAPPASGGIATIAGDSGAPISGTDVTIFASQSFLGCGSSVGFANSGTFSQLMVSDANNNTMIGFGAGTTSITGFNNCAYGMDTLASLSSGQANNFFGVESGLLVADGSYNTGIGTVSMQSLTSGSQNVGVGHSTLSGLVSGQGNVAIGMNCAAFLTTNDSNNILISNTGSAGLNGAILIGTEGTHSSCKIQGISGVTVTGTAVLCATDGTLGTIASSERYKENIRGIDDRISVMHLRPVAFNYKQDLLKNTQYGLIAEDVQKDFHYLCFYNEDGQPESVKYHELPTLLLLEIQRLNARITALEKK